MVWVVHWADLPPEVYATKERLLQEIPDYAWEDSDTGYAENEENYIYIDDYVSARLVEIIE